MMLPFGAVTRLHQSRKPTLRFNAEAKENIIRRKLRPAETNASNQELQIDV